MLSFSHACSVVDSFKTCQPDVTNHFYMRYTLLCVRLSTALHRTFIPQSFIRGNNSNGPVAGRVWGMVVYQGPHKQKTLSVTRNMVV